jgi:hypothetical protein
MQHNNNKNSNKANEPVSYEEFHEAMNLVATKEDLKRFATKEDLKNALKKYATKEDFFRLERRIGNIESEMMTKQDKNELMRVIDKINKDFDDWRVENKVHAQTHKDVNDKLEDHEERIDLIENVPAV